MSRSSVFGKFHTVLRPFETCGGSSGNRGLNSGAFGFNAITLNAFKNKKWPFRALRSHHAEHTCNKDRKRACNKEPYNHKSSRAGVGWYTKIHARIHIDNRNQHCQSHEPCSQNKAIERHLLVMKNVGLAESKSVFVLN